MDANDMRESRLAKRLLEKISAYELGAVNLMSICGTHALSIAKHSIRGSLPEWLHLIYGPGCPVCAASPEEVDFSIGISRDKDVVMTTFGDMMKVPGSKSSLAREKLRGSDVREVESPLDSLQVAEANRDCKVIFFAIGFETTAATVAITIMEARKRGLDNFSIICALKTVPPAIRHILESHRVKVDGLLYPSHIGSVIGVGPIRDLTREYRTPCVIAGFDTPDILEALDMILSQLAEGTPEASIQKKGEVKPEGDILAQRTIQRVFRADDARWRALGVVPGGGFFLREEYEEFDVGRSIDLDLEPSPPTTECICDEIMWGRKVPMDCELFANRCTPDHPQGACMASTEGTCACYYRYEPWVLY